MRPWKREKNGTDAERARFLEYMSGKQFRQLERTSRCDGIPDEVIYDMPVCDGKMTLQMIRESEESKDVPVVFLTGVKDAAQIRAVMALKPDGYILKPPKIERLEEVIKEILGE